MNPYTRLRAACAKWAVEVRYPTRKHGLYYPNGRQTDARLHEYVRTGNLCGFDVLIQLDGDQFNYVLVKRPDDPPEELQL